MDNTIVKIVLCFLFLLLILSRRPEIQKIVSQEYDEMRIQFEEVMKGDIEKTYRETPIYEIVKDSFRGGKRLRPLTAISIYKQLSEDDMRDVIHDVAMCIEYSHCNSLILDDIIDCDVQRRGEPTLHMKYKLGLVQLAIFSLASRVTELGSECILKIKESGKKVLPEVEIEVMRQTTETFNDLIKSQIKTSHDIDEHIKYKTSSLFTCSYVLGWLYANLELPLEEIKSGVEDMRKLGEHYGLMFQIYDDYDDYSADLLKGDRNYIVEKGEKYTYEKFEEAKKEFIRIAKERKIYDSAVKFGLDFIDNTVQKFHVTWQVI